MPHSSSDHIDQANSEGTFSAEQAKKFTEDFDSEEKTRVFSRYQWNGRWSKDAKVLQSESEVLGSLSTDPAFLGRWLDLVYTEADTDRTEKVPAANEKMDTLYGAGRHVLKMDLV